MISVEWDEGVRHKHSHRWSIQIRFRFDADHSKRDPPRGPNRQYSQEDAFQASSWQLRKSRPRIPIRSLTWLFESR